MTPIDQSPVRGWKPIRPWVAGIGVGWFTLLAALKGARLSNGLSRASMEFSDLPQFWVLATSTPPSRSVSPEEMVVFRYAASTLISLVCAAVFVGVYLIEKRRARAEAALLSYCVKLENVVSGFGGSAREERDQETP